MNANKCKKRRLLGNVEYVRRKNHAQKNTDSWEMWKNENKKRMQKECKKNAVGKCRMTENKMQKKHFIYHQSLAHKFF